VLRAKQEGLPLPAAIARGTAMSDLSGAGDSLQTNAMVDNVTGTWASSGAYCRKISSGSSALTVTLGTSTTFETRRSTATLQMT